MSCADLAPRTETVDKLDKWFPGIDIFKMAYIVVPINWDL
jgi:Ulp1 family protease